MRRRNHRPNHRKPRGFTLLELIVALAISIGLVASIFTTLHIAIKAKEGGNASMKMVSQLEIAMEMLRADLEAAQPPTGILEYQFEGTQSGGGDAESDQLAFYNNGYASATLHQDGIGEIKFVTLLLEQQGNDQVLVRQVTPNLLNQQTPTPDEEIICRNVRSFAVQYFDGEQWQTSWDSTQYNSALPSAISVAIVVEDPDTKKIYRMRRVVSLSCVSQLGVNTAASGATGATGTTGSNNTGATGGGNAGGNTGRGGGGGGTGGGGR